MSEPYTIPEIKNIVAPLAETYGVETVYLFGSYARGEATNDSDIDLMIDSGKIVSLFILGSFYTDLQDRLKKPIDIVISDAINNDFYNNIKQEEIIIYER